MFFKKNKKSQPAATVHQSTLGVSEMSDDDLIAVTGGILGLGLDLGVGVGVGLDLGSGGGQGL